MAIRLELGQDLEKRFRETAMRKFGYSKGSLKKASGVAVAKWLNEESNNLPKVADPFKLIEGKLSHLKGKYTSVELQHEASTLWIK